MAGLALISVGYYSFLAPFWCLPSAVLSGPAAAAGIALVNSLGNLAGGVGPFTMGLLRDVMGSTTAGFLGLAVLAACAAAFCLRIRAHDAFASLVQRGADARRLPTVIRAFDSDK